MDNLLDGQKNSSSIASRLLIKPSSSNLDIMGFLDLGGNKNKRSKKAIWADVVLHLPGFEGANLMGQKTVCGLLRVTLGTGRLADPIRQDNDKQNNIQTYTEIAH